jgi:hypothetical protein
VEEILFQNTTDLHYKWIFKDLKSELIKLAFAYLFISLISWDLFEYKFYLAFSIMYLTVRYINYLNKRHLLKVSYLINKNEINIVYKTKLGRLYQHSFKMKGNVNLAELSDSYYHTSFAIKQSKKHIKFSSHNEGVSKKAVKTLYKKLNNLL